MVQHCGTRKMCVNGTILGWLKELHISNILVESEAQVVIYAVNNSTTDFFSIGSTLEDCGLLGGDLHFCVFVFGRRPTNQAAHNLVQAAVSLNGQEGRVTPTLSFISEKAQLVCSTCRKLLLYPRGAKWVQCPGCQEVNFVLEAHEVGQVKCGNCGVLLMYLHGAPAVQCTSCSFVTEIGANNRLPPLSVQMVQRPLRPVRGRAL